MGRREKCLCRITTEGCVTMYSPAQYSTIAKVRAKFKEKKEELVSRSLFSFQHASKPTASFSNPEDSAKPSQSNPVGIYPVKNTKKGEREKQSKATQLNLGSPLKYRKQKIRPYPRVFAPDQGSIGHHAPAMHYKKNKKRAQNISRPGPSPNHQSELSA